MDKKALVDSYFKNGGKLIVALDNAKFIVHSALWLFDEDRESWRMIIASEKVEHSGPRKAYEAIKKVIERLEKERR
ncbi:hypothetical protein CIL05_17130 [Virgibacillus profundi]|uniref:Uncharacterized protein n=1 Tax=Virgibacillus profundi TaxID=2024555 RepID=A0A2A2IAJ5_9BACI|nr:hypothetical protein [Virgibacillus profundi]PAV28356.1 hypothetical protein CIL05_17130 [Virgibacillus profundi]PXY52282.1 hypothetical protein CIT14_18645 [Virgibacillus profundi]